MNLTEAEFDFLEHTAGTRREFKCDEQTRLSLHQFMRGLTLIVGEPPVLTQYGRDVLAKRAFGASSYKV